MEPYFTHGYRIRANMPYRLRTLLLNEVTLAIVTAIVVAFTIWTLCSPVRYDMREAVFSGLRP